jgi:hypothetical protein
MKPTEIVLWSVLIIGLVVIYIGWRFDVKKKERFVDIMSADAFAKFSSAANNSAPTTTEVQNYYKTLLIYVDDQIRNKSGSNAEQGSKRLHTLIDKLYAKKTFKKFTIDDILEPWPKCLPPRDPGMPAPIPSDGDGLVATTKILAYLQANWPKNDSPNEDTVGCLVEDIGRRFVYEQNEKILIDPSAGLTDLTSNVPY